MKIIYQYTFGDGLTMEFDEEMPFPLLKLAVDYHKGLVKCKKIVVMEVR